MSQHLGTSRMGAQFTTPQNTDEKLQAMLTLYQSPATIRDMKQVFFYVQADAQTTNFNPAIVFYNLSDAVIGVDDRRVNAQYYAPIGTTRSFNISNKVNDLLDIRVPKDKYVIEINLAECVIEADPKAWTGIPDKTLRRNRNIGNWEWGPTFASTNNLSEPTAASGGGERPVQTINSLYAEATKQSAPQTLFCRIKQLANGEPYNWAVTNSGNYSIDKSHQLLVRHGDIDQQELELEFGHASFEGYDEGYARDVLLNGKNGFLNGNYVEEQRDFIEQANDPKLTDIKYHRQFKYYDYNREYYNAVTVNRVDGTFSDFATAEFYKGDWESDQVVLNETNSNNYKRPQGKNIIQPTNYPPHYFTDNTYNVNGTPFDLWQQGKPLFYNQQVSKLGFRFLIRVIHMF
jgi:hypothetical protein